MDATYSTFKKASEHAKILAKHGKSASLKRDRNAWIVTVEDLPGGHDETIAHYSIWVGRFIKTGAIVVFDHAIEIQGADNIFGYVPARELMRQFDLSQKDTTRPVLGKEKYETIKKYLAWKKKNAESFVKSVLDRIESKKQRAIQKHKDYLTKIGKPYSGVNLKTTKTHRVKHCYEYKGKLDSDFHIKCNECRWLICGCGACGCGYEYRT